LKRNAESAVRDAGFAWPTRSQRDPGIENRLIIKGFLFFPLCGTALAE
jgi:hypothetical protein